MQDPDWSYKKDLDARAAAAGMKPPSAHSKGEEITDDHQAEAASR